MSRRITKLTRRPGHEIRPANKSQITINCNSILLSITKHENFSANKYENANSTEHEIFSPNNMKMPIIVGIFIFISRKSFKLSYV